MSVEESSRYRGHALVDVAVLPSRVAYLIPEGDISAARSAVRHASRRWGGLTEPIVEVAADGAIDSRYTAIAQHAAVVGAVAVGLPESQASAAARHLGFEHVLVDAIDAAPLARYSVHPRAIALYGPDEVVIAAQSADLWEAVAVGAANDSDEELTQMDQHRTKLAEGPSALLAAQASRKTVLERAVAQLSVTDTNWPYSGRGPAVLWVTEPNDVHDCLAFWNFRALRWIGDRARDPILLLPARAQDWLEGRPPSWCANQLERPGGFTPDVLLYSTSLDHDALHALAELLGFEYTDAELDTFFDGPPQPVRRAPFTYRVELETESLAAFERSYGPSTRVEVHLFSDATKFRFSSPVNFWSTGGTLLHLSGRPFDGFPRRQSVAELFTKTARWHRDRLELRANASRSYEFELHVPSLEEARDRLLAVATERWDLSDKGRIGVALRQTADIAMLREPGVFELLVDLMTPRSSSLKQDLERLVAEGRFTDEQARLAEQWGSRAERRALPAAQLRQLKGQSRVAVVERLCAAGWAERGLRVICPRCGLRSFVALADVGPSARCPGCGATAEFEATDKTVTIYYRLNTLVDRAVDQGVIPHLMAIAAIIQTDARSSLLPGVLTTTPGADRPAEVDIYGIWDGRVVCGEVKTKSSEFTSDQIARDVSVCQNLGADIYLIAATDEISDDVFAIARRACADAGLSLRFVNGPMMRPSLEETAPQVD